MERRLLLFVVTSVAVMIGYQVLIGWLYPPKPRPRQAAAVAKQEAKAAAARPQGEKPAAKKPAEKPEKPGPQVKAPPEPEQPEQWVTLGSADPSDRSRMLVTLTNRGAAVARIELNSPRYCDIDDRSGYLGYLAMDSAKHDGGWPVQVVGPGTPAALAGLKPGDVITAVDAQSFDRRKSHNSLEDVLANTRPGQKVALTVVRGGKQITLSAKLRRRPLAVIQPEDTDPLSMLLTLQQYDDRKLADKEKQQLATWTDEDKDRVKGKDEDEARLKQSRYLELLPIELKGVRLRTANWKVIPTGKPDVAQFRRTLPELAIEITKTYRLVQVPADSQKDGDFPAYHLEFEIEIRNTDGKSHTVAYRLDGPNGLPTEGKWYTSRVARSGGSGIRDYIVAFGKNTPEMTGAMSLSSDKAFPVKPDEKVFPVRRDSPPENLLTFVGVDAQYFSAVLLPERPNPADLWFAEIYPIRVGRVDPHFTNLTNTSCRLVSLEADLKPGQTMTHRFRLFAGPKKPAILENKAYNLGELIYYGWPIFAAVAVPLTAILHFFYAVVWNYGLAIILLTVLVRGCMFPLSLKQVAGAQKMQMLQPEMKKLAEKHKNNSEARAKAQQELFRKHNYNPLSGCLPIFIQMPVFIGLWRCLMVDIELRDAPLLSHSIRWCSNLAGPDMLINWTSIMPPYVSSGMNGIFSLGPYFNILPILAVVFMVIQMKISTPPAADEQAAMQQKMMKYMMIFFGLMFYKVGSGLCIYFIASSLWGLGERRFLPKTTPPAGGNSGGGRGANSPSGFGATETRAEAKARAREAAKRKK
jgi:YidC/Oxa1 family membrane protein insertase